jgi:type I restriction enzyme R subunit
MNPAPIRTNFAFLKSRDEQLLRLGMLAERYFAADPNTSMLKSRQFAELLARRVATDSGLYTGSEEQQYDLLRRLQDASILPREVAQVFGEVRRTGNAAAHSLSAEHSGALNALRLCWQLAVWYERTFYNAEFKSGAFVPPSSPTNPAPALEKELNELREKLTEYQSAHAEARAQVSILQENLSIAKTDQQFWEEVARQEEAAKLEASKRLAALQADTKYRDRHAIAKRASVAASKLVLDESQTRILVDQQLRDAGWEVDTENLRFAAGTRPEKGKNRAIAEWPTESGPADYVLFCGLKPVAAIEAKRKNIDVSASLQQAKRYSRALSSSPECELPGGNYGTGGEFRIPVVFSTNGRPYLKQLETKSGIWMCDLRRPDNLARPLDGWYTPEGILALLKLDEDASHKRLGEEHFNYGFPIRDYQRDAIKACERAIGAGQREMLLAMATGTGKTKTCIALAYRLLKTQRFRRVLFLVDRSALGEQAANAFKETRMESLQTFADIFGLKEIDEQVPDPDTAVQVATIQGMVKRLLYAGDNADKPTVDQYDCIIVDECHRGYLLDRELSDSELLFRSQDDYVSKYRRVLEYFDAVKIGLTATPALHTTEIFGAPIYTYSYREAVIDGFLVDHEPRIIVETKLSKEGIKWKAGDTVKSYNVQKGQIELIRTPDEVKMDVDKFNRQVITESFNRVVCETIAAEIDPSSRQKTLVFCATDDHADLVVKLLKKAFEDVYGSVDDDAVIKITGAADKPLQLIRRYKNERLPNVAVTVDLLTTGIDVPEICNLVFLRRVNSRILFEQMLGRATRLCDGIGKQAFRIFDAVYIYDALEKLTAMKPVVVDPKITFTQLTQELSHLTDEKAQAEVRDQLLAKLQRKKHSIDKKASEDFETRAGMPLDQFIKKIHGMRLDEVASWFTDNPDLGEILDRKTQSTRPHVLVSDHEDELVNVGRDYGGVSKPQDYLEEFSKFVREQGDRLPALVTVLTRPRELTRKQLRDLVLVLDRAGYTEANLEEAWRQTSSQDIAARIIGFIRKAANDEPLLPYDQRVDKALQNIYALRSWTTPQRDWLRRIAAQTKANVVVDREALDDPDQIFRREGGGYVRLNKIFGGELEQVLDQFNELIWQAA